MKDRDKYYGLEEIQELGFTARLMGKYLPDADKIVRNPYNSHALIRFWLKTKIDALIAEPPLRDELATVMKHRAARQAGAKKAVETKVRKTTDRVSLLCKSLKLRYKRPLDKVRWAALQKKEEQYWDSESFASAYGADPATIDRWTVNYIRHNMVDYDYCLEKLKGEVGKDEAYRILKNYVLDLIKSTYPELAEECERQKRN